MCVECDPVQVFFFFTDQKHEYLSPCPLAKHEIVIGLNILGEGLGSDCRTSQMSKVKLSINHFTNAFAFEVTVKH